MRKVSLSVYCLRIILAFILALNVLVNWYISGNLFDADTSSNLVLAQHLSKQGGILSRDWIYPTELGVIGTQLVNSILFRLISSYRIVRFVGSIIHECILLLSFFFLCSSAHIKERSMLKGAIILMLPVSVAWGRIVLYHNYYVPHITVEFLIVGLFLRTMEKEKGNKRTFVILILLSIIAGLSGIRQLMITFIPVFFCYLSYILIKDSKQDEPTLVTDKGILGGYFIALGMCLLGIICNYELTRLFTFNSYLGAGLRIQSSTSWPSVIYAVFHLFGYRTEVSLISLAGILSVLGIGCGIYFIIDSVYYLIHMNFETGWMLRLLFLFSFLTLTFILIFAYDTYYFLLYYIFPYSFIPVLIAEKSEYEPVTLPFLHTRVLVPFIVFLSLVGNGVFNTAWFADLPVQDQTYDGLNYYNRRIVSELSGAVSFLEERQYKWGCSPYWSSNIVTEMTNGAICVTPLEPWSSSKPHYYPWLTFLSYQDIEASPAFLLLSNEKSSMELFSGEIVYSDDYYTIVEYGTSKELWNLIQQ